MPTFMLLLVVGSSIWVGIDAFNLAKTSNGKGPGGTSPAAWVVGCLMLWIVFFPYYLVKRGKPQLSPSTSSSDSARPRRECPHCRSQMRADASVCLQCQRESDPWENRDGVSWVFRPSGNYYLDEARNTWVKQERLPPLLLHSCHVFLKWPRTPAAAASPILHVTTAIVRPHRCLYRWVSYRTPSPRGAGRKPHVTWSTGAPRDPSERISPIWERARASVSWPRSSAS